MRKLLIFNLLFFLILTRAGTLFAQDNYEITVYPSELTEKNFTVFELHSNYTLDGSRYMSGPAYPSHHVIHETLEITRGFTKWLEIGGYLFASIGSDNRTGLAGVHIRPRLAVPEEAGLPFGLSLGAEIGYQKPEFFGSMWGTEIRPIIDRQFGKLYLSCNLTMGMDLDKGAEHELEFSPCFKSAFEVSKKVDLALEYYTDLGALKNISPFKEQGHHLFGAIDWTFNPNWEFNAGLGYGLTPASDKWIFKLVLGRKFPI